MEFKLGDQDNGTLVGLREMLRRAAEQNASQPYQVDASSDTKHYSQGGPVYTGVPKGRQDMNAIQHALNAIAKKDPKISMSVPTPDGGRAPGAMITKRFADGGEVIPPEIDQWFNQPSKVPPLKDVATSLNQTPDTNYDFFKDLSAGDRSALQQRLMAKQNSAPSMIAQGVAGLGDAISNSYGGKNTSFQKGVMENNELQSKKQLDAFDTQRTQKMQDMNANMEMQGNDPRSPLSKSMQRIVKSQGVNVPSNMPANVMIKVLGPLGELSLKQATLEQQKMLQQQSMQQQKMLQQQTIDTAKAGEKNREAELRTNQQKEVGSHWMTHPINAFKANQALTDQALGQEDHGIPDLGQTFNGGKVLKVTRVK